MWRVGSGHARLGLRVMCTNAMLIKRLPSGYFTKFTSGFSDCFVCPLQAIEDDGVGKKFSCIPLQDHRINSWDLPEVVVVTSPSLSPAL